MEKRNFQRIPTHVHAHVRVLNLGSLHSGLITDLSENGMSIITGEYLSSGQDIEVYVPSKEDNLKVPAKIIRKINTGNLYDGFGAELLNSSKDYLEFFYNIRANYES